MTQQSFAGTVPAPDFPTGLTWLNTAHPLTMEQLRGKVVILDFWTYGCINCMHVLPDLKRLEEEYPNELVVIGVHSAKFRHESATENIRQIILRYELEHPVINDRDFLVWQIWGARAWPTLALIDPAGKVVGTHSGEEVYTLFKPVVDSLVREFDSYGNINHAPLDLQQEKVFQPSTVLSFPGKVLADAPRKQLFISDTNHHRIIVAHIENGTVLDIIGCGERGFIDGSLQNAAFAQPQGLALSANGQYLYVADTENHALRQVDLVAGEVTTVAGTGEQSRSYPPQSGRAAATALNSPWDVALDGSNLYIAMAGSHQIWRLDLDTRQLGPFAGSAREGTSDGALHEADLAQPSGLALDGKGRIYFADSESSSIRWAETDLLQGTVGTLVGSGKSLFDFGDVDGVNREVRLQHPLGVTVYDSMIYVADTYNSKIKRINPDTQWTTTLAGEKHGWRDGVRPLFYEPGGLDVAEGKLYVADTNNHAVRIIDLHSGHTRTLILQHITQFQTAPAGVANSKTARMPPLEIGAGTSSIGLHISLPEGYKLNAEASHSADWSTEGEAIEQVEPASVLIDTGSLPLDLALTLRAGEGTLYGDLTIFYCQDKREGVCLVERVQLVQPLLVREGSSRRADVHYHIDVPELPSATQL